MRQPDCRIWCEGTRLQHPDISRKEVAGMAIESIYNVGSAFSDARKVTGSDTEDRIRYIRNLQSMLQTSDAEQVKRAQSSETSAASAATNVTKSISNQALTINADGASDQRTSVEEAESLDSSLFVTEDGIVSRFIGDENSFSSTRDLAVFIEQTVADQAAKDPAYASDIVANVTETAQQFANIKEATSGTDLTLQAQGMLIANDKTSFFAVLQDIRNAETSNTVDIPPKTLSEIVMGATNGHDGYPIFMGGTVGGLMKRISSYMRAHGWSVPPEIDSFSSINTKA